MSDPIIQPYDDNDTISGKSVDYCQSLWMTHWMRKSCKSENRARNRLSMHYEFQEDNQDARPSCLPSGTEIVTDMSKIAKGIGEAIESKTVNIIDESLMASSEKIERSDSQPLSMFNHHRKRENVLAQNNEHVYTSLGGIAKSQVDLGLRNLPVPPWRNGSQSVSMLALAPLSMESPSRQCHFHHEHIPKYAEKHAEYNKFIGKNSLAVTKTLQDDFTKSMTCGYQRSTPENSICREGEINQSNFILASEDYANNTKYGSKSFILVHQKIVNNLSGRSRDSLLQQNDMGLFALDYSTSTSQQPDLFDSQKMQHYSSTHLFPKWNNIQDPVKSEELDRKSYSLTCLQPPVDDIKAKRICTAVGSLEEPSRDAAWDSQTNHHFLFRNISFDPCNKSQNLKESTESTKLEGKSSGKLLSLCPEYGFMVQPGVKLQSSRSSTGSEAEKDVGDVKTSTFKLKNLLSAGTDDMYMDTFPDNHVSGMASSQSNKLIELKRLSSTSEARFVSPQVEIVHGRPKMKESRINKSNSEDGRETSSSRTQSLDAEHLLSYANQCTNSKSSAALDGCLEPKPSSRWVKRLRLSPVSSHGTKSSKMGEAALHKKVNKFFSKTLKCSITCSEPSMVGGHHGKDQDAMLLKNGQSSSADSASVIQEITLSHPWIQRWSRKVIVPAPEKNKVEAVCEAQYSKAKLHEPSKNQFPSLAAMALMGNAMGRFRPCEYTKKGTFVVWKCKGF